MSVWGYARVSTLKRAPGRAEQVEAIARYCVALVWTFVSEQHLFVDVPDGRVSAPDFRNRPAGRALAARISPGDIVVTPDLSRLFQTTADLALTTGQWERMNIALHAVALGGPFSDQSPATIAQVISELERSAYSERGASSAARSKYVHRPVNGTPPLGCVWVRRPDGTWALEPDQEERALMNELLRWHEELGHSIETIRRHLVDTNFTFYRQRGRKTKIIRWNNDAVWKRIRKARQLREQEQQREVTVLADSGHACRRARPARAPEGGPAAPDPAPAVTVLADGESTRRRAHPARAPGGGPAAPDPEEVTVLADGEHARRGGRDARRRPSWRPQRADAACTLLAAGES